MPYTTTHLHPTKSYSTYQLYATAVGKGLQAEAVMKICILETLRWLRSRLQNFPNLPEDIQTPEPADHAEFRMEMLHSFSFDAGGTIDVIWSEKNRIWSFCMTEADMGANAGTANARPPVIGRTFRTEMSYCLRDDHVEVGIRTICSDPYDCDAPCEVFRPTVVKELAGNPQFQLRHHGLNLDGQALLLDRKEALERLSDALAEGEFDLPVVYVAEPASEIMQPKFPDFPSTPTGFHVTKSFTPQASVKGFTLNLEKTDVKSVLPKEKPAAHPKKEPKLAAAPKTEKPELPKFPYEKLAKSMLGFAVVAYVPDKQRDAVNRKLGLDLHAGEILISHGKERERFSQKRYQKDMDAFYQSLKRELYLSPKRRNYGFGEVVFHSEARLLDLHNRRHETENLEETSRLYRLELEALRSQVRELSQEKADMEQAWETLRVTQKKLLA